MIIEIRAKNCYAFEEAISFSMKADMRNKKFSSIFAENNIPVVAGCPELEIKEIVQEFINQTLITGENSCGGEHHHCHSEGHCAHHS